MKDEFKKAIIREKIYGINHIAGNVSLQKPVINQIGRLEIELICLYLITFDPETVSSILLSYPTLDLSAKIMNSDIYYSKNEKQNGIFTILSDNKVNAYDMMMYFCYINRKNPSQIKYPHCLMPSLLQGLYCHSNGILVHSADSYRNLFEKSIIKHLKTPSLDSFIKSKSQLYYALSGLSGLPCVYILKAYNEINNSDFNQKSVKKSIAMLSSSSDYQDALSAVLSINPRKKAWLDLIGKNTN
jgi:hypothetical protein